MPLNENILQKKDQHQQWRRDIHQHPETAYEEFRTASIVEEKLRSFGVDSIATGIGQTGIVATLHGREKGDLAIALRADMDALNIIEENDFDHKSVNHGKMHACGHDGHTTMLLAAAEELCATRNFKGTVYFIFQPAEENEGGAQAMIDDGLFERFAIDEIYGIHNWPGVPAGEFGISAGPVMASVDTLDFTIAGKGGHAAMPFQTTDPLLCASQFVVMAQQIISRRIAPLESAVFSITAFQSGETANAIPSSAKLKASLRSFTSEVRQTLLNEIKQLGEGLCQASGNTFKMEFNSGYPATINSADGAANAIAAATKVVGSDKVNPQVPTLGSEDFSFFLQAKPGAYIFLGNGTEEESCMLHNPGYDFNDSIIAVGASYWLQLVEDRLS